MTRIETLSDLRAVWRILMRTVGRDLSVGARLARDPLGTLRQMGYDVGPEAAEALQRALP